MELEIMPEQVQKILTKITDWWKKFTTKQRILLGSIVAVIILALVILAVVVGKPNMVTLIECSSTAQAGEVKDLLDNDGSISYQMSDDGLTFYVDEKDNAAASILLGQNGVPTEGFSIDNVFRRRIQLHRGGQDQEIQAVFGELFRRSAGDTVKCRECFCDTGHPE